MKKEVVVVLENIRSAHNVGAIFRTADGAGVAKIILIGYTPRPLDRFGRVQPEIAKTSLGASEYIPWEYFETSSAALATLTETGHTVVAIEQAADSVAYTALPTLPKVAFIFGNEVTGVEAETVAAATHIAEIPMSGQKESLNVATTAGIILFQHRDG